MAALSQFFAHIYTLTIIFFTLLIVELIILLRSITGTISATKNRPITTTQYLKLIDEMNPATRYKPESRTESRECAVCLSIFEDGEEIRKLKCKHTFHKDCLDKWLQHDWATCPLCRRRVLPEEIVVKYRQQQGNNRGREYYHGSDEELIFLLHSLHASEDAFSAAGRVMTKKRNKLKPALIERLICLSNWDDAKLRKQDTFRDLEDDECDSPDEDDLNEQFLRDGY